MSDVTNYVTSKRDAMKKNNPLLYFLTGGDRATEYTVKNVESSVKVANTSKKTVKAVKSIVENGFNFIGWVKANWQLAVLGAIALLIIIRD